VLLIDPWVLDNPKWRDRLLEFDRSERTWVSVLVAWNTGDPQTDRNRQRLLDQLNNTLENRFRRRRPGLQLNAHVTASLEDVATALPAVLQEAMHRWLRGRSTPRRSDNDDPPDEGDGRSR
jgi:FxsC-like protein